MIGFLFPSSRPNKRVSAGKLLLCLGLVTGCRSAYTLRTELGPGSSERTFPRRLGVFPLEVGDADLGRTFSELLAMEFLSHGYQVVERTRFESLVAEQNYAASKLFDPDYSVRLGKLVGADTIVLGSIQQLDAYGFGGHWKVIGTVTLRLVDTETGRTIAISRLTRNSDFATEDLGEIAERICSDVQSKLVHMRS